MSALEDTLEWQFRMAGLPPPEREFRAIPGRRYRWDFAFRAARLLVEVQGGVWTGGKHGRGSGIAKDAEKLAEATLAGWRVLVCTSDQIRSGKALDWVQRALGYDPGKE